MSAVAPAAGSEPALSVSSLLSELNAADAAAEKKEKPAAARPAAKVADTPEDGAPPEGAEEAPADLAEQIDGEGAPEATADELAAPEAEGDEVEEPSDAENEAERDEGTPQLEPPRWWSKTNKELFKQLTPELQAVVHEQEETREKVVARVKQESADAKKQADDRAAKLDHQIGIIVPLVTKAQDVFKGRWEGVDWAAVAQQVDPQEYNRLKAEYEKEQQTLTHLETAATVLEQQQLAEFQAGERDKLKTVAPDLVDEKLGPQRRRAISQFLLELKFPADRVNRMSAEELPFHEKILR